MDLQGIGSTSQPILAAWKDDTKFAFSIKGEKTFKTTCLDLIEAFSYF